MEIKPIYEFLVWDNCNNNCKFCFQRENPRLFNQEGRKMVLDQTIKFIDSDTFKKGSHILICGGEIFDNPKDINILYDFFSQIIDRMNNGIIDLLYLNTNLIYENIAPLFNVLDNANLSGFVSRSSDSSWIAVDLHRIQQLSAIVHMPEEDMLARVSGDNYTVESKGLYRLINVINDSGIDSNTFVSSGHDDIQTVKSYRNAVLEIMNCAYDADGEGHRSALVSEFVSGLLNNVLANEFSGLDNKAGYTYNFFEFGNPKYSPYLEYFSYSSLDAKEKNGMQGILDSLDYVSQLNVVALSSMSDTDRHALADNLEDCFALMYTDGENSEIARIVYLNNVHNSLKLISSVMNKDSQTFNAYLVNETSTSSTGGSNTVYAEDFSFADYGTALKNYIYPGFI